MTKESRSSQRYLVIPDGSPGVPAAVWHGTDADTIEYLLVLADNRSTTPRSRRVGGRVRRGSGLVRLSAAERQEIDEAARRAPNKSIIDQILRMTEPA